MSSAPADFAAHLAASSAPNFVSDLPDDGIASFGDLAGEDRALREGAGVAWLARHRAYTVGGAERLGFLQRLLTGNMLTIPEGTARPTLLLDNKGRTQAAFECGNADEHLVAVGEEPGADVGMNTLTRYILRLDVQIQQSAAAVLALMGPHGDRLIADRNGSSAAVVLRASWGRLLVTEEPAAVWDGMVSAGAIPVGAEALERLRIEQARPAAGREITGSEFPQELRLETTIDFDKGCYLGQETVARIHYRGRVNRRLAVVRSSAALAVGAVLRHGEREVGRITSSSERQGDDTMALGLVTFDDSVAGTKLSTAAGTEVTVVDAAPAS